MVDVAKVKLFGMDMGTFRWDESYNVARFEYDKNFADKGIEPSPIMMPVQQGRIYSFGNLNRDTFIGYLLDGLSLLQLLLNLIL